MTSGRRRLVLGGLLLGAAALKACAIAPAQDLPTRMDVAERTWVLNPAYYAQSVGGHLALLREARPIEDWTGDPATPDALRVRLELAQQIRAFASDVLFLPRNASYTRYADTGRRAVVWNVVAAPPHAMQLHRWCFPVAGCVGYKGFYDEAQARRFADALPVHWDVGVYPVRAYSTLGWSNPLGGDPLLNTFLHLPEAELARLIFHELAHQRLYLSGDSAFSESFATAVERIGVAIWLAQQADPQVRESYRVFDERREQFRALTRETRQALESLYQRGNTESWSPSQIDAAKADILAAFRQRYDALKSSWGGFSGYDPWVSQANNALFAIQSAYDTWVPAFEALFEAQHRDLPRFYEAARELSRLPRDEREARLRQLTPPP